MGRDAFFGKLGQRMLDWENGLERRLKEHFTVLVAREDETPVALQAPRGSYYADPFLLRHAGRNHLLVEHFFYADCRGRLAVIPLDENLNAGPPQPLLDPGCHASFPFVFEHKGKLFLLPETSNGGTLDIYACDAFPGRWTLEKKLFDNLDAADSIIFRRNGIWWLITSLRQGNGRHLALYSAEDFLGAWRPHPMNDERRYAGLAHSSGRNAGGLFERDGVLYRVAQHNPDYYGQDIRFYRIDQLSETEFVETQVPPPSGLPALAASFSPHHLSLNGNMAAWDIRDRTGWFTQRRIGNAKPSH